MFITIAAAFILVIVLLNVMFWPRVGPASSQAFLPIRDSISVLIPARDEASNLPGCIESILQQGDVVGQVLIYDDHSTDGTASVIARYGDRDPRVRRVETEPLPPEWCGKNFACSRLALQATSPWILFLDADTRLLPGAVGGMLQEATARNLSLLSCWPGFDMVRIPERVLMPMLNFVVFTIYPAVLAPFRPNPSLGLAHGACMLLRAEIYRRLDGHQAVRNEIFEDTRLAQIWRERGERSLCLDGQSVVRVRMYSSFWAIWKGFQKNFYPAFRHEWMFFVFLAFHFAVFLLPFLIGGRDAVGLVILARLLLAARFSQPWWSALLHPISEVLLIALGISSWWQCRTGRGVAWKGRVYRARA